MASSGWRENRSLKQLIFEQYGRFNVFQLVRLLQSKQEEPGQMDHPGAASIWRIGKRFRFRSDLSASFPGREISRLSTVRPLKSIRAERMGKIHEAPEIIEIKTPNYCIAGTLGPLPAPFTDWLRQQERDREDATINFLDIFNQRLNVLRFELKAQRTMGLNNLPPGDTLQAQYLASLMGLGQPELAAQVPLPRRAWLGLAGLLSNGRRSAPAIAHILSLYVGVPVKLTELVGAWQRIEPDDRVALGKHNHRLGRQSVLGRRVWDQQARIRLEIAPLDYAHFCRFLPPGASSSVSNVSYYDKVAALLRLLVDGLCDCEVRLQVLADSVTDTRLRKNPLPPDNGYRGLQLGHNTWLASRERTKQTKAQREEPEAVAGVTYLIPAYGHAGSAA